MQVSGRRKSDQWKVVAALDFGTTYSGYAYCIKPEVDKEPEVITNPPWSTGAADIAFPKTPTTILFDKDKKFVAFGFEAETKYSRLVLRNQHENAYYFTQFKMKLYSEYGKLRKLNRSFAIDDIFGKAMSAMTVFSEAIKYLKAQLEATLKDHGHNINQDAIRWVLTVPAIWDNAAKQFMRESAKMAGIPNGQLVLALEPEAATLQVMKLSKVDAGKQMPLLQSGARFINLDLGGGTADVTVHRVSDDGKLTELYRPTGGYWGGTQVDNSFDKLLCEFVGQNILNKWKSKSLADYLDLKKDFEALKRSFSGKPDDDVAIRLPNSIVDAVKDNTSTTLEKIIEKNYVDGSIVFSQGRLIISGLIFEELFKTSVQGIVNHLNKLLRELDLQGLSTIVLVGGFSQSVVVKNAITKNFRNLNTIFPDQPGLCVLKGATLFGLMPETVLYRVTPYTYGVNLSRQYHEGDPAKYCFTSSNGIKMVGQVFDVHVREGDKLAIGTSSIKREYTSVNPDSGIIILFVYRSTKREPKFVDEEGCVQLGDIEIKVPTGHEAALVEVEIKYWDTEIVISAIEKNTGAKVEATLDVLGKK